MNKALAKEIIYTIIAIVLGIITIKFIIWLLPVILIAICSYYIYKFIKRQQPKQKQKNQPNTKKKPIKIIDMVEEE